MVYFQFFLVRTEIMFFPDIAVYRQHEVIAFDVLSKKVESENDTKNTFVGSWRFILKLSHRR